MSTKRLVIFAIGFIVFLAAAGLSITLILENFEQLWEEGIQFDATPGYVNMDRVTAPVTKRDKFDHYLYIDVKLEVADESHVGRVQKELPRVRDAALRELHRAGIERTDGVIGIDIRGIKSRLLEAVNQSLGEKLFSDVLVTKLVQAAG